MDILQPGPGAGGHCIAVDPWFIVPSCREEAALIKAREINDAKPAWVVNKHLTPSIFYYWKTRTVISIRSQSRATAFRSKRILMIFAKALPLLSSVNYTNVILVPSRLLPNLRVLPSHFGNCELHPCTEKIPDADIHLMLVDTMSLCGQKCLEGCLSILVVFGRRFS